METCRSPGQDRALARAGQQPGAVSRRDPKAARTQHARGSYNRSLSANKRRKRELEGTEENLASLPYIELTAFMAELRARKGTTARMKNRLTPPDFSLTALLRSRSTPWRRRISFS